MEARGFEVTTAEAMRKALRVARRAVDRGSVDEFANYPFTFDEDVQSCVRKAAEIEDLIGTLRQGSRNKDYFKCVARADWGLNRMGRAKPESKEEASVQRTMRSKFIELLGRIHEAVEGEEDVQEDEQKDEQENVQEDVQHEDDEAWLDQPTPPRRPVPQMPVPTPRWRIANPQMDRAVEAAIPEPTPRPRRSLLS